MIPACKLLTVQAALLQMLDTSLPWETLGAIPEMLQTAWGSLFRSLQLKAGDRLLIRGGTTSVGCASCSLLLSQLLYLLLQVRELVGTSSLEDNLQCTREHAIVCMTGMVGNKWYATNLELIV